MPAGARAFFAQCPNKEGHGSSPILPSPSLLYPFPSDWQSDRTARQASRQTYRQLDKQSDRLATRQADTKGKRAEIANNHTDRQADRQTNTLTNIRAWTLDDGSNALVAFFWCLGPLPKVIRTSILIVRSMVWFVLAHLLIKNTYKTYQTQ